jgi:hypothetical protein
MPYEEKFDIAKNKLIKKCKELIIYNWERMFGMWLGCEMDIEFTYQHIFKTEFEQYVTDEIESKLFFAGHNVKFAIRAFMSYNKKATLNTVLKFMESFILEQLDDFDNWCDEIGMAMYEETSEYEREFGNDGKEDNPS